MIVSVLSSFPTTRYVGSEKYPWRKRLAGVCQCVVHSGRAGGPCGLCFARGAQGERKSEPRGLAVRRVLGQQQYIFKRLEAFGQIGEVFASSGHEPGQFFKLTKTASGLHVGDLQVVAELQIQILVVVAFREAAQFPAITSSTGVVLARIAPAVTAPVAN